MAHALERLGLRGVKFGICSFWIHTVSWQLPWVILPQPFSMWVCDHLILVGHMVSPFLLCEDYFIVNSVLFFGSVVHHGR